jgi:hypothetical protein
MSMRIADHLRKLCHIPLRKHIHTPGIAVSVFNQSDRSDVQRTFRSQLVFVQCLYDISPTPECYLGLTSRSSSISRVFSLLLTYSLVPWTQSRFSLKNPTMPSFESSSLDEQTLGRLRFFNESATPPRVPRSIALMNQEIAIGYVLVLSGIFDLIVHLD